MFFKKIFDPKTQQCYYQVSLSGFQLLRSPLLNKGTAFPLHEREKFNLLGLLPTHVSSLEEQCMRSYQMFKSKANDIERYIYLRDLQDSNETLFYALIDRHIEEMMPIVYTPVVGAGCQRYSHIFRRPRGLYLSYEYKDKLDQIFQNPRFDAVEAIVVSDGERILGLGDQGIGGMGIPVGKLSLYTACAGIHPCHTLPVLLDTGTNNQDLLNDPLYMGWRHERVRGEEYDDFVDAFVQAVKRRFPHVLLQWEDFAIQNATRLLHRYRNQLCTFNDDVQGTAAVVLGTLLSALPLNGLPLDQQKVLIVGAGSAGCGIGELIAKYFAKSGISKDNAYEHIYLIDKDGLVTDHSQDLLPFQQPFIKNLPHYDLLDAVKNIKPSILIGVSGQPNLFNETVVRQMAQQIERPIIFPLSNPTTRSEANPEDLMRWTNNKALVGTGSPFGNIMIDGKPHRVDQTNNCYIFPGMGLGLIAAKITQVTDDMFMEAAIALSNCSPSRQDKNANLLPPLSEVREVSYQVALSVAKAGIAAGLSMLKPHAHIEEIIKEMMWTPDYYPFMPHQLNEDDL